jgi:hypothetical protein
MLRRLIREIIMGEAPIRDFEVIGKPMDQKGGGFSSQDRKLLSNPKAIEKIKSKWEKTPYVFDIYLLKVPELNKPEFREVGEVRDNFRSEFEKITGESLPNNSSSITILFNGNFGAEKMPMTAWIMAHRFGHAVQRTENWKYYIEEVADLTNNIFENVYNKTLKIKKDAILFGGDRGKEKMVALFFNQIGDFKSARENKINRYYEFFYEVFAQYLLTGKVSFRPLTEKIVIGHLGWGHKEYMRASDLDVLEMWNRDLEIYCGQIESRIEQVISSCVGKTFLM